MIRLSAQALFRFPEGPVEIPFVWEGDSLGGRWEPHAALLIPVTLPDGSGRFYFQFDTGSPKSLLYSKTWRKAVKQCPGGVVSEPKPMFRLGAGQVVVSGLEVLDFGDTLERKEPHRMILGTLGTDLIDQRIVRIGYPGQKLTFPESFPAKIPSTDFTYIGRRILLPAVVSGQKTMVFFDTGTSAFEWITDEATANRIAIPGRPVHRAVVPSWNKSLEAVSAPTDTRVQIGDVQIPLRFVTCFEGVAPQQVADMRQLGIGGMVGNKLFLSHVLILDTRHHRFALVKP